MSYEGYVQTLCANGHAAVFDCWDDPFGRIGNPEENPKCDICGADLVWRNGVDQTNCCSVNEYNEGCDCGLTPEEVVKAGCKYHGAGYIELEVKTPAQFCECEKCGNKHCISPVTYKIPERRN